MKKIDFITKKTLTKENVKALRRILGFTQQEFAAFIHVSKPTVERWESGEREISGPVTLLWEILMRDPEYAERFRIPARQGKLRLWYMHQDKICTMIDVDETARKIFIKNYVESPLFCAFGRINTPSFEDYEKFLKDRCFPESRDKVKLVLRDLGIPFYDPLLIIEKTEGRMAEDDFWIKVER